MITPVPSSAVPAPSTEADAPFQTRVHDWVTTVLDDATAHNPLERGHRFLEEAVELIQAVGVSRAEAHQLVDYVFDRPRGEIGQEMGGTLVTLAALATALGLSLTVAGEAELARIWEKSAEKRAKFLARPKGSPLPIRQGE